MPGNVSGGDGLLHGAALRRGGLFEVLVEEPGAGGPDEAVWSSGTEGCCGSDGLGIEDVEVLAHDGGLSVGKADVEVAFEDDVDPLDFAGRRRTRG